MDLKLYVFILLLYYIYNSTLFTISEEEILKKNEKKTTKLNFIVFYSKDFSNNNKMNFMLKSNSFCDEELKYVYYDSLDDITINPTFPYSVSLSEEENEFKNELIFSNTKYFSIKKNKEEFKELNGDYLLLYFSCSGEVEIENYKMKLTKKIKLIIALIVIALIIIIIIAVGLVIYFKCYKRKIKTNNQNVNSKTNNILCIYCGSKNHISFNCPLNSKYNFGSNYK